MRSWEVEKLGSWEVKKLGGKNIRSLEDKEGVRLWGIEISR